MKPGELVIYVDESGSPDVFNSSGDDLVVQGKTPNHLVIGALRCPDPNLVARCIQGCLASANGMPATMRPRRPGLLTYLHATEDDDVVRALVCSELVKLDVKATAIVMDKRLLQPASPWRTDRQRFYNELLGRLLSDSLHLHSRTRIVLSHKNWETAADLQAAAATIASSWTAYMAKVGAPISSTVTATTALAARRPGLQAVDYVAWSLFRVFERRDMTYYRALQPVMRHVWDLGRLTHHSRRRPIQNPP